MLGHVLPEINRSPDPQLEGLKRAVTELRRILDENKKELELSHAQIEQLREVGTDESLALIAAAGAPGKTGKSRSHAEIAKLKDAVEQLA